MSWRDTLSTAQARLVALEAAEDQALLGQQVAEIAYDGETLKYAKGASLSEIRGAIRETKMAIQRLDGSRLTGGAIIPRFGF